MFKVHILYFKWSVDVIIYNANIVLDTFEKYFH